MAPVGRVEGTGARWERRITTVLRAEHGRELLGSKSVSLMQDTAPRHWPMIEKDEQLGLKSDHTSKTLFKETDL